MTNPRPFDEYWPNTACGVSGWGAFNKKEPMMMLNHKMLRQLARRYEPFDKRYQKTENMQVKKHTCFAVRVATGGVLPIPAVG